MAIFPSIIVLTCLSESAPPTEAKAYQRLVEDEHVKLLAGQGEMGDAALITLGLELEEEQYVPLVCLPIT
jgi:hypothetical protein